VREVPAQPRWQVMFEHEPEKAVASCRVTIFAGEAPLSVYLEAAVAAALSAAMLLAHAALAMSFANAMS
jgi:hypothetical protein